MMKKDSLKTLLVLLVLSCLLAAGPVKAGYMGFTAQSLQTEDSDGC
jgi:hypothetical protein